MSDWRARFARRLIKAPGVFIATACLSVLGTAGAQGQTFPNDPYYGNEWYAPVMNLPQAWGISQGSSNVTIAVLDTGVISTTPDLAGRVLPAIGGVHTLSGVSPPYTDAELASNSALHHGTWVASVAAMGVNNGIAGSGVGNFSILPIDVANTSGLATPNDIATAIRRAADEGAKVINVSFGAGGYDPIETAAEYALGKGALVFISAGNSNAEQTITGVDDLIFVSGTMQDSNGQVVRWNTTSGGSSYGSYVSLSAPAWNVLVADPADSNLPNGVGLEFGTSFSAPFASGAAALAWSINPNLTPDQVRNILFTTADDLGPTGWDEQFGWGQIDFGAVASAALATVPEPQTLVLIALGIPGLLAVRRFRNRRPDTTANRCACRATAGWILTPDGLTALL